jgi:acyl carrier protein
MKLDSSLQKVIAGFFNKELKDIKLSSSVDDIEEWDSLEHIKLILEIEERFNVKFPLEVIPNMTSIKAIQEELNRLKADYV